MAIEVTDLASLDPDDVEQNVEEAVTRVQQEFTAAAETERYVALLASTR